MLVTRRILIIALTFLVASGSMSAAVVLVCQDYDLPVMVPSNCCCADASGGPECVESRMAAPCCDSQIELKLRDENSIRLIEPSALRRPDLKTNVFRVTGPIGLPQYINFRTSFPLSGTSSPPRTCLYLLHTSFLI